MEDDKAKALTTQVEKYGRKALDPEAIERLDELKELVRTKPEQNELYFELLARALLLTEILMATSDGEDTRRLAILGTYMRLSDLMLRKAPSDSSPGSEASRIIAGVRESVTDE